jgi:hypothetical protein
MRKEASLRKKFLAYTASPFNKKVVGNTPTTIRILKLSD